MKITLEHSYPEIWRELEVDGRIRLSCFHELIQIAMGWENCHLHLFKKNKDLYMPYGDLLIELNAIDEDYFSIFDLLPRKGCKAVYEYDFGDSWIHLIEVTASRKITGALQAPKLLAGKGACPPEDSGGIYRYCDLLPLLDQPDHEDYEQVEWCLGEDFDPTAFDRKAVRGFLSKYAKEQKLPERDEDEGS
nr:plasmid pRiA4b ORF-3 family protein [Acanthopleuribacter pedis]